MTYVEVLVGSLQYHGQSSLTYSSIAELPVGSVVTVPLRKQDVLGIVVKKVPRPSFAVKPIKSALPLPPLAKELLALLSWLQLYYPTPLGAVVQLFLPRSLSEKHLSISPLSSPITSVKMPKLTTEQSTALAQVCPSGLHILHGETGSGKTRIYIELATRAIQAGRSAIILTPEIGLTPQLARDFKQTFGDRVLIMHSQLTVLARQKAWLRTLQSPEPLVIIGPRSALFSPLANVGLIVLDEAHENAYKQEQAPHYQTSRVAARLGQLHDCPVILGSATPLVTDYFLASQKHRPIIRMQSLATGQPSDTKITVVDLTDRKQFNRHPHLSEQLLHAIETTLSRNEQILLFLNRRGTARVVFCDNCGWQALCPHCDIPLIYHGDDHTMRCHTCSYKTRGLSSCPSCGNASIVFKSIGTKAIADAIATLFPKAIVRRFDTDNLRAERMDQQYDKLHEGDIDILVGTQTVAKGLDLPHLGLVGVIAADTGLYMPDYTAEERTYELLSQVLGRVGRGHRASAAVIQTYHPKSSLLRAVLQKNWPLFYEKELEERKRFMFPPFCFLLKLTCRRASSASAQKAADQLATQLRACHSHIIEGPTPSFHEKVGGKYQWQLLVKATQRSALLTIIAELPSGWSYDIDPINLL